ncbi:unnamed protein product [Adineta steineri]|uniref:Uncharacterized protein n=1 Tax=Adineta steineri TaxID=433720 RepID=A0A814JQB6_9BILA|nr:unnamed protein product [Adineta steineri]CAF1265927.1 unnamed protein product [Adineta steineri]
MQQTQGQNFHNPRLSTSSYSSLSAATTALLNGLLPGHRFSQTSGNAPTMAANLSTKQLLALQRTNNRLKRSQNIKRTGIILILSIILACLLLITIQCATRVVKLQAKDHLFNYWDQLSNDSIINRTNSTENKDYSIRAFFTCVWIFNALLLICCFLIHLILSQRRSSRNKATAAFLREFGQIFHNRKSSSNNTLADCLIKTCLLCFLWYSSCYFIFRSMTILISMNIIIIYSVTVTARQFLGWIFLHEQFIGNKIIAIILGSSTLLFLAHSNGFRLNEFLLGVVMMTCAAALKTIFDILIHGFIKDLTDTKLRIAMINVCFLGTFVLWPFVLLIHFTQIERLEYKHIPWSLIMITLICSLTFNILTIVIPFKYSSVSNIACLLFVIPSTAVIDRYLLNINYSPLVISAILCSFGGTLLSIVPKQWFHTNEKTKMKQTLGLLHKDSNVNTSTIAASGTTLGGTSSALDEIRAQRRIRNALLYNEVKT